MANIPFLNNAYFSAKVGIGTESPDELLHISSTGDAVAIIEADSNNDNEDANPKLTLKQDGALVSSSYAINGTVDNSFTGAITNGAYIESSASFQLAPGGALSTTFLTNGNVGIGTASPNRTLQVNSGTTNIVATFESSDTLSRISFVDSNTSSDSVVQIGAAGNELVLFAGGAEHVRVDSAGNVGIGTTSPSRLLSISNNDATTTPQLLITQNGTGDAVIGFNRPGYNCNYRKCKCG
jgi:hypothetical protein